MTNATIRPGQDDPQLQAARTAVLLVADGIDPSVDIGDLDDPMGIDRALEPLAESIGVSLSVVHETDGHDHLCMCRTDPVAVCPV